MKSLLRSLVFAAALAPLAPLAFAQQAVDKKLPAAPDVAVDVENPGGTVKVLGWDREEVQVTGRLDRRADGLLFDGGPRRIRIGVESSGPGFGYDSDLEIRVPHGARVSIDGFSTEIEVRDVHGAVEAESVNGSMRVSGSRGAVDLETVNGSVQFEGPATRVQASSVNGRVTVRGASGVVDAETVNGPLEVVGGTFSRADLETVNGSVLFGGSLEKGAVLDVESVSGDVELRLGAPVDADFTIGTFSGRVDNRLSDARAEKVSLWTEEKELRFSVGAGSAKVTIETLSGSITIGTDGAKSK
ncbi:MAG: DUF4097 family beta strand repeat protein [Vicinamibacteria bacterium]|nr:DUF4097 family beta strand repeat protein [Vicinamibacteria bacterium]